MLKKIALSTVAAATMLTAMPAAAEAQSRSRDYGYEQSYRSDRYYEGRRYDDRRRYSNRRYYNQRNRRCDGTTGTIAGAAAGALLGKEVAGRRRDETTGLILGGALGALAGRAIDKSMCRGR